MNPTSNPLEGFSPEIYLATLSEVAHADGLHPIEEDLLSQQAIVFGVDMNNLPAVPKDLSHLPWSTRIVVYRDAVTLAFADDDALSNDEQAYLGDLAKRMDIPSGA